MANPSKLENLANHLWEFSYEEVQNFMEVATKIAEAKAMLQAAEGESVVTQDQAASDHLREIRQYLADPAYSFSGPEAVLLVSFYKMLEGAQALDTRSLNIILDSYGCKPSNTTTTVENLEKKALMEFLKGEDLHAHKSFLLTETGKAEARDLVDRLQRQQS